MKDTSLMKLLPALVLLMLSLANAHAAEEALDTVPIITAKAWAISDAATGEVIWHHAADEPRKAASTAKTMCAYTVLCLAEKDPALMEEWMNVSKLAGTTAGSTAGLQPGESVQVKDCLLGLLLPSGNDAGNVLAEHLNARLAPPDEAMLKAGLDNSQLSTRVNFIAEMNRNARKLGMKNTLYRSAFGDGGTEEDRTTTARDLSLLAFIAMQKPDFRRWVATRRHTAIIKTSDGDTREAVWENSNQLLALDLGYDGIKTGITNQAGHCLIASGQRGTDRLHVVVLGCTSEESRYADARNLFRWAWTQQR
jgi:D-alanyl-D-alanine carboxypeptidase (penicillin-binding protein 5/6)